MQPVNADAHPLPSYTCREMSGAGRWGSDVPGQVVSSWHIGPLQLHALLFPSVKLGASW